MYSQFFKIINRILIVIKNKKKYKIQINFCVIVMYRSTHYSVNNTDLVKAVATAIKSVARIPKIVGVALNFS